MDIKHLQFSFRMYWANMKGLLNMVAEGIILVASLASLFILVYQFGFKYSAHVTHMLETSRVYLLLAFFTGISLRYILKFKEIIQEKMLYLDIGIYFFLFAVLSGKVFFKEAIHQSLPYLGFLTEPLFVYFLLLLLSAIHLSRQTFTLLQSHIKPSLLFLLSFVFVILVGSGLLMLPNATVHGIHFVDALFISTTSVCVTGLTTVDVATTFTHTGHIIIMFLIQIGGIGVMTFTSFFALSFMGHSSFTSKLVLKDMLNEDRVNGLFRVILNILFVTLFIEGVGAYLIYLDIKGGLPGGTQEEVFYAVFHAVSAFCNAGISTLSGNMYDPLVAQKYNLHVWIALLIVFGGLGFPIVFNYLKLLRHLLVNTFKIVIGQQKHYIHTPQNYQYQHVHRDDQHVGIACRRYIFLLSAGNGQYARRIAVQRTACQCIPGSRHPAYGRILRRGYGDADYRNTHADTDPDDNRCRSHVYRRRFESNDRLCRPADRAQRRPRERECGNPQT